MSEKAINPIDFDEFQSLVDGFIERSSPAYDEMPASTFFELLFEKLAKRVTETLEVEGKIINNRLVLQLPVDIETAVQVKDNEILIGDQRIVVKLKEDTFAPTV